MSSYASFAGLRRGRRLPVSLAWAVVGAAIFAAAGLAGCSAWAQTARVPALLVSDLHFDPFADPGKVERLDAAPLAEWGAILAGPATATQKEVSAALQRACPVRGTDTSDVLWRSSLRAMRAQGGTPRFVAVSGDLLAHQFDCKYKTLVPKAGHVEYLGFVEKTIGYVVSSLRVAVAKAPVYVALGNNDSGCGDYRLDAPHDDFLAATERIVAEALTPAVVGGETERKALLTDFARDGSYNVPLAGVPRTRMIVLDDLVLSAKYATCGGAADAVPAAKQLAWLSAQLDAARQHKERVWVMGHIPPGVDLYTTARQMGGVCSASSAKMFLGSEGLAEILAGHADVVRLALFGHTHNDEMRLLGSEGGAATGDGKGAGAAGVPVKLTGSVSPVNGNRPSFTLAEVDAANATLVDYTVVMASNLTGVAAAWAPEYTFSSTYHQRAFDAAGVGSLIDGFAKDPAATTAASRAYLRDTFPGGEMAPLLQLVWPLYGCAMGHDSAQSFAACVCPGAGQP